MLSMGLNDLCRRSTWLATKLTYMRLTSMLECPRFRWNEIASTQVIRWWIA